MRKYHKHRNELCTDDTGKDYTFDDLLDEIYKLKPYPSDILDITYYLQIKYEENGELRCLECMD